MALGREVDWIFDQSQKFLLLIEVDSIAGLLSVVFEQAALKKSKAHAAQHVYSIYSQFHGIVWHCLNDAPVSNTNKSLINAKSSPTAGDSAGPSQYLSFGSALRLMIDV